MTSSRKLLELHIHRIELPTPFPVGPVNAYLVGEIDTRGRGGGEAALVDCGVKSSRSRAALAEGLGRLGGALGSVGSVLITHPHDDHAGAAPGLSQEADLTIRYHPDGEGRRARNRGPFGEALRRYGAPARLREQIAMMSRMGERFGDPLEAAPRRSLLREGDRVALAGLDLEVMHTPGHDPAHLCFLARDQGVLFCGDLLLPDITPNPLPHFDANAPRGRQPSLALFRRSLRRMADLGPLLGLGGHGPPMEDTAAVAAHSLDAIARRSDQVLALAAAHPGSSLFALAGLLFGQESELGQVLAFTEILAHCDDLEDRGLLQVDHDAGVVVGVV